MKRTLLRTWKILLLWLFVCYELGSLLDYLFFFSVNLAFLLTSWAVDIIVYIWYNCIFCTLKYWFTWLFKWAFWCFCFIFHLLVLILFSIFNFLLVYWDPVYIFIGKELALTLYSVTISFQIVWFDISCIVTSFFF